MANPIRFTPLIAPSIFGNRDLREYMLNIIETNSAGAINDRAPHAPTVVITDAMEFCRLELEYSMDKIAEKAAILHLQTCGIQRLLGSKAQVTLTFTLSATLPQFVLSAGYMVTGGGLEFFTDTDVLVTNAYQFTVTATAKEEGVKYNVAAYTLTNLSQARAYLTGVTNLEPARGGLNAETEEDTKARGFQAIRRKKGVLISADDFEQYAMEILGPGSIARAIGLLTPDKLSKKPGFVHIFCLNPDGTQLNAAQTASLQSQMTSQLPVFLQQSTQKGTPIASGVTVSTIELYPLEIHVIATLIPGDDPETRASTIYQALTDYLAPGGLPLGQTIILYSLITVVQNSGVADVQSVVAMVASFNATTQQTSVQSFYSNIPLPNEWTAGYCLGVTADLVDTGGDRTLSFSYGAGGDLD